MGDMAGGAGGAIAGGGGGNAGQVDYPDWIKFMHEWMLADKTIDATVLSGSETYGMMGTIKYLHTGSNPLTFAESYDPDSDLDNMQLERDEFKQALDTVDPEDLFDTYVEAARDFADSNILTATQIQDKVDSFDTRAVARTQRAINRVTAGMDLMKALNTQWIMAMAQLERDHDRDVSQHETELTLQNQRERIAFITAGLTTMMQVFNSTLEGKRLAAMMQTQVSGAKIIAKREQNEQDISYDIDEAKWDLRLYQEASGVLASVAGATVVPKPPDRFSSMLSGILGGAAQFGSLATPFGPAAAGIWSLIGGAAGGFITDQSLRAQGR